MEKQPQGQTYSFRAECMRDVGSFLVADWPAGMAAWGWTIRSDPRFGDTEAEFTSNATVEQLRQVMRQVIDGHVMVETLRPCPLAENSLERAPDAIPVRERN